MGTEGPKRTQSETGRERCLSLSLPLARFQIFLCAPTISIHQHHRNRFPSTSGLPNFDARHLLSPQKEIGKPTEKGKVLEAESASAVNKPAAPWSTPSTIRQLYRAIVPPCHLLQQAFLCSVEDVLSPPSFHSSSHIFRLAAHPW